MPTEFGFQVTHTDSGARRGRMTTAHGDVETPAFMPVGTQGAVKGVTHRELDGLGAEILLSNTYHLYLRPGDDLIARRGGLHRFIGWSKPILTDSGGYQVFSLSNRRTIDEAGAHFRSHLDGSAHSLTPEKAADIQAQLGSDVAMILDECLAHPASEEAARASMERTLRWACRGRDRFLALRGGLVPDVSVTNPGQAQFGIVQGSVFPGLREESAVETVKIGFEAYAIGGLSVGEPPAVMYDMVARSTPWLPADRPRYLMGTGTPEDLVESVARGIDLFDCVLPTRNGRNAMAFTDAGPLRLRNAIHQRDDRPLEENCPCLACRHSRGYLRHLFLADEMLGPILLTHHNLTYYQRLLADARRAIEQNGFSEFCAGRLETWRAKSSAEL
jgi:queuine tRNA-ribosyltransferase